MNTQQNNFFLLLTSSSTEFSESKFSQAHDSQLVQLFIHSELVNWGIIFYPVFAPELEKEFYMKIWSFRLSEW